MKYPFALLLSAALLLAGCGEADDATRPNDFVPLTAITIESQYPVIADGTSNRFRAIGNFSGEFERDITAQVVWESLNPAFLTIDGNGLGHGASPGTARIIARSNGIEGDFFLEVADATLQTLAVTPDPVSLAQGLTQQFTATGTFVDTLSRQIVQDITRDVSWSSADETIATISSSGLANAVKAGGPVAVTATFAEDSANVAQSVQLTVTNPAVQSLTLDPVNPVVINGRTLQFKVIANFSDGTKPDVSSQANWSSSNTAIAAISATGLATAAAEGSTTITAEFSGKSASTVLNVSDIASIAITPANPTVSIGNTQQLTATATLTDNSPLNITTMAEWSVSGDSVTVDNTGSKGQVTGVSRGTAQVTASLAGKNGTITVTVP